MSKIISEEEKTFADALSRLKADAIRYRWLRSRDLETIDNGGVFAGQTPENIVLNGDDLDAAIDEAMKIAAAP